MATTTRIGDAIGASFGFLRTGWNRAWGIMLLVVWIAAVIRAVQLLRPDLAWLSLPGDLVLWVAATAATGALYRIGIGPDHAGDPAFQVGPAGFNWGGVEWRVLVASLVVGVIFVVLLTFAIIVWAFAFGVSAATQGADIQGLEAASGNQQQLAAFLRIMMGPAGVVSTIIAIPIVVGLLLLGAKLALFAITSADTRSFNFGHAWSLTKGALAPLIVTGIVIVVVQAVLGVVAGGIAGAIGAVSGQARLWGGVAGAALGAALNAPLVSGLQIYVYRAKRGGESVAQTFS